MILLHAGEAGGSLWVGLFANAVTGTAFLAIAVLLAVNAIRSKQVKNNPLGVATVILFVTCAGGHIIHTIQLSESVWGPNTVLAASAAFEYESEWHMWTMDVVTAIAGVTYWMMRKKFPALVSGAAIFEDLRGRQQKAVEIHDNIVQGLVQAKLALDMELDDEGDKAVDETLQKARGIVSGMLVDERKSSQSEADAND